jgi:hypothetical protein
MYERRRERLKTAVPEQSTADQLFGVFCGAEYLSSPSRKSGSV